MIQRYVIWFLIIIKLTFIFENVHGHVALTFPQARKYDIDFLDNARTPGPCGMPKGKYFIFHKFILIIINFFISPCSIKYIKNCSYLKMSKKNV